MAGDIKSSFEVKGHLVVHWDGARMEIKPKNTVVEKFPVVVTGQHGDKLLDIHEIKGATGGGQASAVLKSLENWNIKNYVKGMCFDTTPSNTGK